MKRTLLLVSMLSMAPAMLYAQTGVDTDIDAELEQISAARTAPQVAPGNSAGAAIAPQGSVRGQPIYILNQATPTANSQVQTAQVQQQPQVDVVAAPLTKSRAEQIREARQQAEVNTENKIVEKLEQSRIDDEKRRANVLFGEPFNQLSNQNNIQAQNVNVNQQNAVQQAAVVAPAAVVAQPVPVVVAPKEDENERRERIREEVRAALKSEQPVPEETLQTRYFGAMAGIGDYPDANNVKGNYSLGASFGTVYDKTLAVEGIFTYSDYTVDQYRGGYYDYYYNVLIPRKVDAHQYAGALAIKYIFLDGMIKPIVGGLVQYSYRTYNWSNDQYGYGYSGSTGANGGDANSHAVDIGAVTGVDVAFNKKFTLGFEFKYMWNLASRVNNGSNANWFVSNGYNEKPIEKLQYYTMGVVGRVNF